jgi:hypothetical protein
MVMKCFCLATFREALRVLWLMIENSNGFHPPQSLSGSLGRADPLVLTLEMPDVEEIAKAIWERQHNKLRSHALSYQTRWRDESVPYKFWEEFLLDAQAVLQVLYRKHVEYESK